MMGDFDVPRLLFQCRDGMFPSELWLGVSREAISVYKRGEPWPLEVFPYEQILSFGAPLSNTYKITVEGRELVFETQMVCTCSLSHNHNFNAGHCTTPTFTPPPLLCR